MGEEITVDGIEKELNEQGISVNFNLIKNWMNNKWKWFVKFQEEANAENGATTDAVDEIIESRTSGTVNE
jgi:hypothetical protein